MSDLEVLRTSLRRFRELCETTMLASGTSPKGLRGVAHLRELEAVFAGDRAFRGELLDPLSAFSNLLASGRLPGDFPHLNFGDACCALGEVLASKGTHAWRFDPDVSKRSVARLGLDRMGRGLDRLRRENRKGWDEHGRKCRELVSSAMQRARETRLAVVVGGARAYDVPLDEIERRFARVVVLDVDEGAERFDATGAYNAFAAEVGAIVARARNEDEAERGIDAFVSSYDVPEDAVRLSRDDHAPDLVVSSMVLTQLALPFRPFVARAFQERGFDAERVAQGSLGASLAAFACRLEQHHVGALLRIPNTAVLISDVGETPVTLDARGNLVHVGERRTQLAVETLLDRIPRGHEPGAQAAWDWLRVVPKRPGAPGASMSVEAFVFEQGQRQ
jgi:hypothetical protein